MQLYFCRVATSQGEKGGRVASCAKQFEAFASHGDRELRDKPMAHVASEPQFRGADAVGPQGGRHSGSSKASSA